MSRSRKKNPISTWATTNAGTMKFWKSKANRRIRRLTGEIPNNSGFKKQAIPKNDSWNSPGDGKTRLDPNDAKNLKYLRK